MHCFGVKVVERMLNQGECMRISLDSWVFVSEEAIKAIVSANDGLW